MPAPLTAIVIEPSPVFREVLRSLMETLGLEVRDFGSAELALKFASESLPNLVCMASLSTDLPARDAIGSFRALAARRPLCALLITSTHEESILMNAYNQGFDGIVPKSQLDSLKAHVHLLAGSPRINPKRLSSVRILYAEDGELQVAIVKRLVVSEGGTITAVPSGEQAWELANRESFDLILTDFHLDGVLTGVGLIRRLKQSALRRVPVIVVSGVTNSEEIVQIYRAGADDFVRKPTVAEELLTRVLVWSGQTRS